MKIKIKLILSIIFLITTLSLFAYEQYAKAEMGSLRIYFLDVGQGDAILIRTPEGKDILVDGGPDDMVLEKLDEALPFWDRYIDIVVLTHPHADHINGLYEVMKRYKVDFVLEPSIDKKPESMVYFNNSVETLIGSESIINPIQGDSIVLGDGLVMNFLYPFEPDLKEEDLNDTSLIFRLSYGKIDFLFTGDATEKLEKKIIKENLESEFLKVAHHGSRYSSSSEFLEAVRPLISIISVGKDNKFGHPTQDAIDRLSDVGSKFIRTDISGTVRVDVDKYGIWKIKCSKGCG